VDKEGHVLDGTAFAEKTLKKYKSSDERLVFHIFSTKTDEKFSVLMLKDIPYLKFYGTVPDENGVFSISRMYFVFNNFDGWMEGDIGVSGTGRLVKTGTSTADFSVKTPIDFGEMIQGSIENRDSRFSGTHALMELRGRRERILNVTAWMKTYSGSSPELNLTGQKDFENYWQPILFPETVKTKLCPPLYTKLTSMNAGENSYAYSEGIKWNTSYTEELLPEHLRHLRNNGSLFRDWEEAAAWFYVEYYWDTIEKMLGKKYSLIY
jgi:hypothetical protein